MDHILLYFRKMNAFLDQFKSKSKHSTVSREAAAAAATSANDSTLGWLFITFFNKTF